jgi:lipoate-protein ligase A
MIVWCDGAHDPAENMRRDAALLAAAEAGAEPVLRLFRFAPHGITLGLGQRPERELDLARCRADGVPWAPRPTGGRAIFHAEEWTYALASPIAHAEWGGSLRVAYARASRLVLASLTRLGVPAAFARAADDGGSETGGGSVADGPRPSVPCFASAARHELQVGGRKLVGSAQRRAARGLLQQGSILLGDGHLRLADYLPLPEPERRRARAALRAATASAGPFLGAEPPLERWAEALMALLGPRSTRIDAAAGAFLLTPSASDSYTSPAF